MSNQKIRSLIYTAIFIALLGSGIWFLLAREDGLTAESAETYYSEHQNQLETIASYMLENEIVADVTDVPTPDEHYGIQSVNRFIKHQEIGHGRDSQPESRLFLHTF